MQITIDEIKENLNFAAEIMRRLPAVKVQGYFCMWPKFCADEDIAMTEDEVWLAPLPDEIAQMEKILEWLKLTTLEKRRIIWLRSCNMGWKQISARTHRSRSTLVRDYNTGLNEIFLSLNQEENQKNDICLKAR